MRRVAGRRPGPARLVAVAISAAACGVPQTDARAPDPAPASDPAPAAGARAAEAVPAAGGAASWSPEDWSLFETKVREAAAAGLDTLPLGEGVAALAISWVDTPYTPGTLEADGPERLVINFREFDCVTFVENVLATSWFLRNEGTAALDDPAAARAAYEGYLTGLRYRAGKIDGYPSRLHYFSEWLADNDGRGLVEIVTEDLEPAVDAEPIRFMSTHPDAYRQLADPAVLAAIEANERALNAAGGRRFVPEDRIAAVADRIESGDVIAATSTVEGLDIAHTGIAAWIDGTLRLVHAPLVGRAVEISEAPLADRIVAIGSQDGIMVARPREVRR